MANKLSVFLLLMLTFCLGPISVLGQEDVTGDEEIPLMETPEDMYERLVEEIGLDIEFEQFLDLLDLGFIEDDILQMLVNYNSLGPNTAIYFEDYLDFILDGNTHEEILVAINEEVPFDPFTELQQLLDTEGQESLDYLMAINDSIFDIADIDLGDSQQTIDNAKQLPIPQEVWDEFTKQYFDVTQIKELLPTDGKINGFEDLAMIGGFYGIAKALKDLQLEVLVGLFPEYEDDIKQHIKLAYYNRLERLSQPLYRWMDGDKNGTPNDSVHELIMTQIVSNL